MTELGLVVNAHGVMPDRVELGVLGLTAGWVRTIVYNFDDLDTALSKIDPTTKVCALLNSETAGVGGDYANWPAVVGAFAARFRGRVAAVECGNELDLLNVSPLTAANLVKQASHTLRAAGMKVILTSVAGGGWVDYLERLAGLVGDSADYACLHPYGQRAAGFPANWGFGELADAIQTANDKSGLPVVLTEYGIKVGDAGGEQGQAAYVQKSAALLQACSTARCPFACYFAWRDDIGGPDERGQSAFGLRRLDGSARPAWNAFSVANGGPVTAPPAEQHGDVQWAFQEGFLAWSRVQGDLLGKPDEPSEHGGIAGFSQLRTTRGILTWADLKQGEVFTFFDDGSRKRYRWEKGWGQAVEM